VQSEKAREQESETARDREREKEERKEREHAPDFMSISILGVDKLGYTPAGRVQNGSIGTHVKDKAVDIAGKWRKARVLVRTVAWQWLCDWI